MHVFLHSSDNPFQEWTSVQLSVDVLPVNECGKWVDFRLLEVERGIVFISYKLNPFLALDHG
jgi:hypothetical protein